MTPGMLPARAAAAGLPAPTRAPGPDHAPAPDRAATAQPARQPAPVAAARPRVLILTVGFGVGGAEQLILSTAPRLLASGFEVTVGALKGWGTIAGELQAAGVPCVAFGGAGKWDLRPILRLYRFLRRGRIDLVHAHLFLANVAARLLGRLAGVPVVVTTLHDTDVWMRARHRLAERLTAPLSARVLACSEAVRRYAIEVHGLPPHQVRTLRNAIAIPEALPDAAARRRARSVMGADTGADAGADDIVIGTVGRLCEPKKGLGVFLRAAARVAAAEPRARFVLVGDGPARPGLEEQAAALGIDERTTFLGERRDVAFLLGGIDIFVQPSLWEGFGLTVIEAMAAARPVVATRVGGVPEVLRDGEDGILVPPADEAGLAAAILDLAADPELARRMGRSGRSRAVEEFDLDRLVAGTAGMYRELLAERDGRRG